MRGADEVHPAGVAFGLEPGKVLTPGHEVVDLLDLDTAVEADLFVELGTCLRGRGRPDLRGDDGLGTPLTKRPRENLLGTAIHRRAVEQPRAPLPNHINDLARGRLSARPDIKGLPRAEPNDRHIPPRPPKPTPLHHARIIGSQVGRTDVAPAGGDGGDSGQGALCAPCSGNAAGDRPRGHQRSEASEYPRCPGARSAPGARAASRGSPRRAYPGRGRPRWPAGPRTRARLPARLPALRGARR